MIRWFEAEDPAEEVDLCLRCRLDRLRPTETVTFAFEHDQGNRQMFLARCLGQHLSLRRRHHPVFRSLQQQDGCRELIEVVDRRPLGVDGAFFGIPAYQALEIARLKLVRVGRQCLEIGDPVLADTRGEDITGRQGSQGCEAAGAAAPDCQPGGVGEPLRPIDNAPAMQSCTSTRPQRPFRRFR